MCTEPWTVSLLQDPLILKSEETQDHISVWQRENRGFSGLHIVSTTSRLTKQIGYKGLRLCCMRLHGIKIFFSTKMNLMQHVHIAQQVVQYFDTSR